MAVWPEAKLQYARGCDGLDELERSSFGTTETATRPQVGRSLPGGAETAYIGQYFGGGLAFGHLVSSRGARTAQANGVRPTIGGNDAQLWRSRNCQGVALARRPVAMRSGGVVSYIYGEHLGSTSLTTNASGTETARQLYRPYGTVRWQSAELPTDYTFTGQREDATFGLIHMGARWYNAHISRWTSADTIVPGQANPQSLNRFAYVEGAPLRRTDPTGHMPCGPYCPGENLSWQGSWGAYYQGEWDPTQQAENEHNVARVVSFVLDLCPVLGDAKGVVEAFTGADLITGEPIGGWRWLGLVGFTELKPARQAALGLDALRAANKVDRWAVQGGVDAAKAAARRGDLVLPGLFRHTDETMEVIEGFQRHHLWPVGLGGPEDGWAIYIRTLPDNWHTAIGGVQNWVDRMLMQETGLGFAEMRRWATENPESVVETLRTIYADIGIDFPY